MTGVTAAIAAALVACAPHVDPATLARYVAVESSGDQFAIHDNATDIEYHFTSLNDAVARYEELKADEPQRCAIAAARGRYCFLDIGLLQIDESNFAHYHVSAVDMFDLYHNIRVADDLLLTSWQTVLKNVSHADIWARYEQMYQPLCGSPTQVLLCATASVYNANSAFANPRYVKRIVDAGNDQLVLDTLARVRALHGRRLPCGAVE